jgi:hypothetical protein
MTSNETNTSMPNKTPAGWIFVVLIIIGLAD